MHSSGPKLLRVPKNLSNVYRNHLPLRKSSQTLRKKSSPLRRTYVQTIARKQWPKSLSENHVVRAVPAQRKRALRQKNLAPVAPGHLSVVINGLPPKIMDSRSRAIDRAWATENGSRGPGAINRATTKHPMIFLTRVHRKALAFFEL